MSSAYSNVTSRRQITTMLTPVRTCTRDEVNEIAAQLDVEFGQGAAWELAYRFQMFQPTKGVHVLLESAYSSFVEWGEAALRLGVHPGSASWTVEMITGSNNEPH